MSILRLKEVIKEKGITGKELSERLGVSQNTISNIANGYNFPKPELLKDIADTLDVDIRKLFKQTKLEKYDQIKHKQLVEFINIIEGKDMFKVQDNPRSLHELTDTNEIHNGIVLMLNTLNISGGSNGEYNLYQLLNGYLTHSEVRKEINKIIGH